MEKFIELLETAGSKANDIIWHDALVVVLLAGGLYFTIRTGFVQVRRVKTMAKLLFSSNSDDKGVSSFQAFALSVAGRVGTGNIAGVATAIAAGGPGALFWMWVIATLGSATAYVESTLGQLYKEQVDGEFRGGPAYYFQKITGRRFVGVIFAIITLISMGLFLPGVQANSIASAMQSGFAANADNATTVKLIIGAVVAILLAVVIFGGTKRLAKSAEFIVPFMSGAYIIIALTIIILNFSSLPEMFGMIFKGAFNPESALGGVAGVAIMETVKNGVKRGLYSNEAGQGTGPHAAAAATVNHPAEQGLVQAFSVYFDTLLVCTATGFMIILTQSYYVSASDSIVWIGNGLDTALVNAEKIVAGPDFTQSAVATLLGDGFGPKFVAIALFFFAFTTLMAYYYMAESNIAYLTGKKLPDGTEQSSKLLILITRIVFLVVIFVFSGLKVDFVWTWADVGVGIMAWYNVVGILAISLLCKAPTIRVLKDYESQLKAGVEKPVFDPKKLGFDNTECW